MFDKIQSTYFKRVTTGVLALFMTASSGFSYAVPVYAQEVTTAAAKRKKEEEFSSTESSTLTLRENDKKNEAEGSKTTETDGIKVTTNGSSDVQPEVKIEKPDNKKEPGRKLSSKKAQEDLKEMIQNKKYSYQDILQRIFEIDDFTFYSKLTLDEIKFLMSGTTEEKYEIAELLMYKSVYLYADYDITTEDFYSYLFQYFQFLDECNVDLKDEEIEKIEKQLLLDINIYYVGDKDMYQKDLNEYLENTTSPYNKKIQKTCSDYVKAMKAYLFALKEDRDKNKIRLSLGLKEETKTDQEEATEQMKKTSNDFNITEGSSLKTYDHRDKDGDNLGYNSGSYFYVQLVDEGGATTTGKISVSGRSSSYGNKDSKLYGVLRDKETTWNCSLSCSPNNHNLSLNQTTVTTRKDDVKVRAKRTAGSDKGKTTTTTSYFIMNFSMGFTVHAHYNYSGRDYDIPSLGTPIRFNTDTYAAANNGTQTLDTTGTVHSDTPEAGGINVQINTGMFGVRTYNSYRYRGTKLTLTYKKPQRTLDVNGRLDGSDSGGTTGYGTFDVYLNGSCVANDVTDFYKTDIADGTSYEINDIKATNGKVYNGVYSGSASGSMCGNRSVYLKFDAPTYYLDINGELDGTWQGNLDGLGSCDVYVNGTCVGDDITDFWTQYPAGTKWEIRDIKTASGKKYRGITPGLSGTIGSSTASVVLQYTSGSTLSIDPNGGTYKGSSGVTTVNNLSPGATITVDSPTRPGYKFGGYEKSNESYQSYASNTGWTTSHGENVGTYSRSYDGSITYNEAPDGGYYRTNHVWRGIDSATDNYNCISFPTYTAQAGHTYKISGEVWISERPSGGSFALNFYHGDSSNDWKHCMWGISEGWTGKWVKFSIERTFDTTTNDARFEIWTSNLKGLTGNISFWLQGLKITDETTGNDVSMTKIAMGDSDIKLTARWIPLHSTLSYDAQGGSLGSVKSTDNPNNYKIVDNGAYFIQSGLNTSRYLHQRTNGQLNLDNATDVLTWNGYSSDSKQTLWTFERYKNTPYYYIINNFNGKAMNLSGDGPDDLSGKPIELWKQYDANNEDNSDFLWYFKDTGDGYVNIYNKMTNKALDITNGEDADGVVLQQYAPNGTASQKFKLVNYSQVYFPTREKYANNNIYINSATPVKKGCKFLGWSTSANGNVVYQPGDLYDVNQDGGNVTLYAKWEKAKYTATVKLNGGSYNGSTNDFTISKYPGEEISIGAPTRSKHNFTGYKLTMDNNDGDAPTSVTQSASGFKGIMQMGNFTLNAQWTPWKHTVRYDANAKNDTSVKGIPASQSKTANVDIKLSSDVPTRNGYTFLGWNTQADGKGTAYAAGAIYKNDQNGGTVTLYAQWTPWKHVLHYNKNVPTSSTSQTVSNMPVDQTKTFGQLMTISNLVPTRKGYTFAGWYTQSNGTGTKYDPGSNYAADQNGGTVNLYAKWTPWTYNIKYDQNVKSTSSSKTVTDMPAAQTKTQEIDVTLSSMTPKRNGYIFAGWSTSANGSVEYKPGSRFTKDLDSNGASITLYAVWTPWKHTIHYNSNIPTNAPTGTTTVSNMPGDQTKTFDEKLMISSNKPTRKGYNFAGWSTSANGDVVYQPGAEYKNDQNGGTVTLYAKWTTWKHTVTYDKNVPANSKKTDVKNMPGNQTKIYDQNLTLQSNVPTRIGYTFVKWTTNKDGTGTAYQPGSQYSYNRDSDGGTVTLYAVWTPWKYTVRYDKNVPANSSSQTVSNMPADQTKTEEVNLTLSSNKPSRNGYIFNGWQAQINGKAVDYQPGATLSYDPDVKGSVITLKAKWTAWKHTIHYDKNVPASSKKTNVTNMPGDQVKVFDTALSIQPMVPKRTGYTFKGWSTTANGKAEYQPGNKYNHDQNDGTVTLYAVWTPWKYKVQYDKNVSADSSSQTVSNMPTDQTKTEEVNLTLSSNKPSRHGYIFNGWQAQINGKAVDYQPGATLSYDVDDKDGSTIILKAQWTAWKHTVHYDKNVPANSSSQTVTNMPEDQTKTFDEKLNLSTKIPKREGYNFRGWLLEYGTAIAVVSPGTAYERDQNGGTYVLKAQWEPWKHTVHYDANGGDQSSVPNDQKKTYEQNMNVATKVPTRNEYKFLGWKAYHEYNDKSGNKHSELIGNYQPGASYNYDIDETGQYAADNGEYNKCGTVTMKAQWVQLYTVKYDGNQPAIKGVTVTGSVANQTQGQDESVNLRTNNFKNNSGIYKDWSVGKDAYKYGKLDGKIREFIHPEGFKTNHSTMQNEYTGYEGQIKLIHS
ncbi:InlB B-repeat-containing protein [Anaerostipes hadrus]|uniref:InlB B-repeat-containing protein n=1 Tax=Anaerostipes hadrus TaxID=649756 RepID=UPI0005D28233|nr:InlB B-repeat-containing protein [Anaerostipes hadrus]